MIVHAYHSRTWEVEAEWSPAWPAWWVQIQPGAHTKNLPNYLRFSLLIKIVIKFFKASFFWVLEINSWGMLLVNWNRNVLGILFFLIDRYLYYKTSFLEPYWDKVLYWVTASWVKYNPPYKWGLPGSHWTDQIIITWET